MFTDMTRIPSSAVLSSSLVYVWKAWKAILNMLLSDTKEALWAQLTVDKTGKSQKSQNKSDKSDNSQLHPLYPLYQLSNIHQIFTSDQRIFTALCILHARCQDLVTVGHRHFFWSWRRRCVADLLEPWQIPRRSLASPSHTDTDLGMNSESGILHHEVSRSVTSPKAQLNDARTHKSHKDTMHMLHLREPQIPVQGPSHLSLSTTTGSGAFQKMYRQVVGDLRNLQRSSHRWTIAIFVAPIASDQRKWLSESPQRLLHAVLWPWECWPAPSPTGLDIEET